MKKTSGNPTLDKNLECINKYNSKLADEILNLPCLTNNIELVETDLKEPNLLFNGVPLHSPDGAENEVKDVFNTVVNTKLSVHIVFGMGLGYLFQKACEMSKGNVFLYEPNLEILRVTLELVDFSKELTQKNVFVMSDFEEFRKFYLSVFKYKTSPSFLSLNSYINLLYADNIKNIQQHLHEIACDYSNAIFQQKVFKRVSYKNVLKNIAKTLDAPPLMQIKGICRGKSALVISPGPTLDFNIEIIKKK